MPLLDIINRNRLFSPKGPATPNSPWANVDFTPTPTTSVVDNGQQDEPANSGLGHFAYNNQATPALDRYKQYVEDAPDFDKVGLNKLGKILAVVAGASTMDAGRGYETSKAIMDEPRRTAIENYKMKGSQLGELAGIEEKTNASNFKVALDTAQEERERQLANNTMKTGDSTRQLNQARITDIANKAKELGIHIERNNVSGKLEAVNIHTGERRDLGQFDLSNDQKLGEQFSQFQKRTNYSAGVSRDTFKQNRDYSVKNPIPNMYITGPSPSEDISAQKLGLIKAKALLDSGTKAKIAGKEYDLSDPNGNRWSKFFDANGNLVKPTAGWMGASQEDINNDWNIIQALVSDQSSQALSTYKPPKVANPMQAPPVSPEQVPEDVKSFLADQDNGYDYDLGDAGTWTKDKTGNITRKK
jgi:hypothetical protein